MPASRTRIEREVEKEIASRMGGTDMLDAFGLITHRPRRTATLVFPLNPNDRDRVVNTERAYEGMRRTLEAPADDPEVQARREESMAKVTAEWETVQAECPLIRWHFAALSATEVDDLKDALPATPEQIAKHRKATGNRAATLPYDVERFLPALTARCTTSIEVTGAEPMTGVTPAQVEAIAQSEGFGSGDVAKVWDVVMTLVGEETALELVGKG